MHIKNFSQSQPSQPPAASLDWRSRIDVLRSLRLHKMAATLITLLTLALGVALAVRHRAQFEATSVVYVSPNFHATLVANQEQERMVRAEDDRRLRPLHRHGSCDHHRRRGWAGPARRNFQPVPGHAQVPNDRAGVVRPDDPGLRDRPCGLAARGQRPRQSSIPASHVRGESNLSLKQPRQSWGHAAGRGTSQVVVVRIATDKCAVSFRTRT